MGTVEFDFTFFVEVRGDLVGLEGFPVETGASAERERERALNWGG